MKQFLEQLFADAAGNTAGSQQLKYTNTCFRLKIGLRVLSQLKKN